MLIILALLPLKVSLTRSAILAAALLLLAFRQAADFVLVTVLAIAMLWLGKVWKSLFLQSEQQLSELRQQQSPPSAPKIRFSDPGALAFRFATTPDVAKLLGFHAQARCGHTVTPRNRSDNPATSDMTGDEAALDAWSRLLCPKIEFYRTQTELIDRASKLPYSTARGTRKALSRLTRKR